MADAQILAFPEPEPEETGQVPVPVPSTDREQPLLREVIGDVLRDERHAQGRTLIEVAGGAAVSFPYLSEVERGRKEVSSDLLEAISTSLGLGLGDVLERAARRVGDRPLHAGRTPQLLAA